MSPLASGANLKADYSRRKRFRHPVVLHLRNYQMLVLRPVHVFECLRLNECLFIRILVLPSNVRFEIIKTGPPLPRRAVARFGTSYANIAYLIADTG